LTDSATDDKQKVSKLVRVVETTVCQSWHIFIETQCMLVQIEI